MSDSIAEINNSKWFVRVDSEEKPTSLMLYNFVGAKFEAHCIAINNAEEVFFWIEKIYPYAHIREVFEQIIFSAAYPDDLFEQFLKELCRVRDKK